jgi:DNA-binding CsgD family transcriptional regulator
MMNPMMRRDPGDRLGELSPRQREILARLARGQSTKEIASDLSISVKTVETHRAHIKEKLHATTASHLVAMAADWIARQSMAENNFSVSLP